MAGIMNIMRTMCVIAIALCPATAAADGPATECPSGYAAVIESNMIITDGACPAGYSSVGHGTNSCLLETPDDVCIMYAPPVVDYDDDSGIFVFEEICPLG